MKLFFLSIFSLLMTLSIGSVAANHVDKPIGALISSLHILAKALGGPSNSVSEALAVNNAAQQVVTNLQSSTKQLSHLGQLSAEETESVLKGLDQALPDVRDASQRVIVLKAKFRALGIYSIAKSDVLLLQRATTSFTNEAVKHVPASSRALVQTAAAKLNDELSAAARAYI